MDLKNLIEKTEIQRKTILELITKAETKEEVFKEMAVERFLKGFLTDLKNVDKHLTEQCAINGVVKSFYCCKNNTCNKQCDICKEALDSLIENSTQ